MSGLTGERWIFVEDSPFLPARGGGEVEHLGMLRAAAGAGVLALVIIPAEGELDLTPYRKELGDVPIIVTPRRASPLFLAHPRDPFVVASRPAPKGLAEQVRRIVPQATGVVVTSYKSWRIGESVAVGLGLPAVLRMHNREGAYHHSLAGGTAGPRGWALRWDALRIDRDERRLAGADWLAGTADISADDAKWRRGCGGKPVIALPPFAVDPRRPAPPRAPDLTNPTILFLGALDVATNIVAVQWLLEKVWPKVRNQVPTASLAVVGRRPDARLTQQIAATAGCTLHADVPEIAPYLTKAAVAVNPAVVGSGVNIKLIEYLHAGLPLVSTSLATRGLPLDVGSDLLVADDPVGFANAVIDLLNDPRTAAEMGRVGQAHLLSLIDPVHNLELVAALLHGRSDQVSVG